jgi:hypothetical protein
MRRRHLLLALLLLLGLTATLPASTAGAKARTIPFADARLKIEVNATDGDAGLQVFLDGEPWKAVSLYNPAGRKLVELTAKGPPEELRVGCRNPFMQLASGTRRAALQGGRGDASALDPC